MAFSQFYDTSMSLIFRAYLTIGSFAMLSFGFFVEKAFNAASPERIDGLHELSRFALYVALLCGVSALGTYLFRKTGFEMRRGYRQWFLRWAIKNPKVFGYDRILTQLFGVGLVTMAGYNLLLVGACAVYAIRHSYEIAQWLANTAI